MKDHYVIVKVTLDPNDLDSASGLPSTMHLYSYIRGFKGHFDVVDVINGKTRVVEDRRVMDLYIHLDKCHNPSYSEEMFVNDVLGIRSMGFVQDIDFHLYGKDELPDCWNTHEGEPIDWESMLDGALSESPPEREPLETAYASVGPVVYTNPIIDPVELPKNFDIELRVNGRGNTGKSRTLHARTIPNYPGTLFTDDGVASYMRTLNECGQFVTQDIADNAEKIVAIDKSSKKTPHVIIGAERVFPKGKKE